jgi:hypothetical protein
VSALSFFCGRKVYIDLCECRYKNDPQIKAMTDLVDAYQRREVHSAEKILKGLFHSALLYYTLPIPIVTSHR